MVEGVRKKIEMKLLELEGVVGVSHENPKEKIILYVESQKDVRRMPRVLAGIPVETVVIGKVRALPLINAKLSTQKKVRPLVGGVSIGPPLEVAGTLGIIIDGKIYTNAHVIALDFKNLEWYPKGTEVYQPSWLDGGTKDDVVGHLEEHTPIQFNEPVYNIADVAVAEPTVDFEEWKVIELGTVRGISTPKKGMKVRKVGRTTGVTESQIFDTKATIKVDYGPFGFAIFKDCVIAKPAFAKGGDSGSPVLCSNGNNLVGLVFAGSEYVTIINSMHSVFSAFKEKPELMVVPIMILGGIFTTGFIAGYFTEKFTGW